MPVKENEFSLSQLWPPSSHNWMAPGAVRSREANYGPGLDLGALKVEGGVWKILYSHGGDLPPGEWPDFDPANPHHLHAANAFRRYGVGWSYGPAHNMHHEVIGYYEVVHGRKPSRMEQMDIEHDRNLWQALQKSYYEKIGFDPTPTQPPRREPPRREPPTEPPPVVSQPPGLPPLSPPEQRAAELLSLLPPYLQRSWMTPLIVEAVKAGRRAQDRVVQRVIAGLRDGT